MSNKISTYRITVAAQLIGDAHNLIKEHTKSVLDKAKKDFPNKTVSFTTLTEEDGALVVEYFLD